MKKIIFVILAVAAVGAIAFMSPADETRVSRSINSVDTISGEKMGVLITGTYSDHFIKGESFKGTIQAFGYVEAEGTFTISDGEFAITGDDGTTVEVTQTGNFRTIEITGDGFEIKSENLIEE